MKFWQKLDRLMDRLSAVIGALVFVQAPEFFQQYLQRLGGHLSELKRQHQLLEDLARKSGRSISDYLAKYLSHADPDLVRQGEALSSSEERYLFFQKSFSALSDSTTLSRPWKFLWYFDSEVFGSTLVDYRPAAAFTLEGLFYAMIGALIGYGCYSGVKSVILLARLRFLSDDATKTGSQ